MFIGLQSGSLKKEEESPWHKKSAMGLTKLVFVKKKEIRDALTLIFGIHKNVKMICLLFKM